MENELIKALAPYPHFVCWKGEPVMNKRTGEMKISKRPMYGVKDPAGNQVLHFAKSNNPTTWGTYEQAAEWLKVLKTERKGLGFVLTLDGGIGCIDLDHCLDSSNRQFKDNEAGKAAARVMEILTSKCGGTYTEVSPSGEGLHIWGRFNLPTEKEKGLRNQYIEIYRGGRFMTVTGEPYTNTPVSMIQPAVDEIIKEFHLIDEAPAPAPVAGIAAGTVPTMEDRAIIEVIRKSKQREKFHSLYDLGEMGAYGNDQSAADQALMNILAYYSKEPEQLKRLFLSSALGQNIDRKKHHEADYLNRTIGKALGIVTEGYRPKEYAAQKQAGELARDFDDSLISGGEGKTQHKDDMEWPHVYIKEKGAKIPFPHWENMQYFLENVLHVTVRLNTVSKKLEFSGDGAKEFQKLSADSYGQLIKDKLQEYGIKGYGLKEVLNQLNTIAEVNRYSPVCDYLNQCEKEYDGKDYARELFSMLELDPDIPHDEEFCYRLFLKWFVSAVQIAFNSLALKKPYTTQGVLVFIGPPGIGKTRFFQEVILKDHPEWFISGERFNPSNKDSSMVVWSCWIFELAEFNESANKREQNNMKSYIDKPVDRIRPPYAAGTKEFARTTALFGTSNTVTFLNDETGNRRYWPIPLKAIHMRKGFNADQVWGQMMRLWKTRAVIPYLEPEKGDYEKLNQVNESYREKSDTEQVILDTYQWDAPPEKWGWRKATRIVTDINNRLKIGDRYTPTGVGQAMQSIMLDNHNVKHKYHHGYCLPPEKQLSAGLEHDLDGNAE